jgi:lipocalin
VIGGRGGWFGESYRHYLAAKSVKTVDLNKYAGTWKQQSVKNVPWFQKGLKDVTATYTLKRSGQVEVVNRGVDEDGKVKTARGIARSVSPDNKTLKVSFSPFGLFEGEYKIKSVDPDYTKAVVQGGKTTWVLVRPKKRYMYDNDDYGSIVGAMEKRKDMIPGGLADKKLVKDFDQKALREGMKVELEHTNDPLIAREIAMDHLAEDSSYYQKLKLVESKAGSLGSVSGIKVTAEKLPKGMVYPVSPGEVKDIVKSAGDDVKGLKKIAFIKPRDREQEGAWAQLVRGKRELRVFAQPKSEVGPHAKHVNSMMKNGIVQHEIGHHVALNKRKITDKSLNVAEARADAYAAGFDVEDKDVKRFVKR